MDMKQILLIGQFNTTTQNLKRILGKNYQIQLASDSIEMVIGILKMDRPDLILILTTDMENGHREIFTHIQEHYPDIPVVYVGTKKELELFQDFEESEQFVKITRPVQVKSISQAIAQKLGDFAEEEVVEKRAPWEKKRILVIDDSGIQRNTLKNLLQEHYIVEDADSGKEAFQKLQKWMPDLILLDYDMPEQNGKEIFEKLQKEPRYREIPVVFLTGVKEKKKIQAVLGLMPAGYLLKPVEQSRLTELLEDLIGI